MGENIWSDRYFRFYSRTRIIIFNYNVGYARIPTYKEKKFIEIDGEVVEDEIFSEKVADDTIAEIKSGRSLIILRNNKGCKNNTGNIKKQKSRYHY